MLPQLVDTIVSQRFRLLGVAGQGGMGTVYRALDEHTGRTVAVKILHPEGSTAQDRHRFQREAAFLAQLHHPHIVAYVDHGHTEAGVPYLAMDWLEGESLGQRMRRQPLSLAESLLVIRHIADALSVAHRRGIIHRDLKPSKEAIEGE